MTAEKVVPLARARRMRDNDDNHTPEPRPPDGCPVTALGHRAGKFYFLNRAGEIRELAARALGTASELAALFVGHTGWLEGEFPQKRVKAETVAGETVYTTIEAGFNAKDASTWLMRECDQAGIWGSHVQIRRPGIWRNDDGSPIVHVGTRLLINGLWVRAGQRIGNTVWVIDAQQPVPSEPCGPDVGHTLLQAMHRLWSFRKPGGATIMLGLIGAAYYGAAATWRPNGFVVGGVGAGKSMLLNVAAACLPMHHFTNDTSAAGVQSALNGHAKPVIIDEATDRNDASAAERLMNIVLGSSGGDGVRGYRGTADGGVRSIELSASFIYGATALPALGPAHLGRITPVELAQPESGADHRAEMEALVATMQAAALALWGRALDRFDDWKASLDLFREALKRAGCLPREMDQMAAILASAHVLTEDGVPTPVQLRAGIAAVSDFTRSAEDVRDDDNPRRVVEHLLTRQVQYDKTTMRETIGTLLRRAWEAPSNPDPEEGAQARVAIDTLVRSGIRPIRAWELLSDQRRPVPRGGDGDGLWFLPTPVRGLFRESPWESGDRWAMELRRLASAAGPSKMNVRIGGIAGKAIWLGRDDIDREEPVTFAELVTRLAITPQALLGLMSRHEGRFPIAQGGGSMEQYLFDPGRVKSFVARLAEDGAAPDSG